MSPVETVAVADTEGEVRLDRWFKRHYPQLGHGDLERLLRTGQVRVDGRRAKAGDRLAAGQRIRVPPLAEAASSPPAPVDERAAAALRRAVLYKDADVLVLDKPAGLAVQGGVGILSHLDAMLDALRFGSKERPRLVHRLDRDTSGVLVLARSARAAGGLAAAFRQRSARKLYWAIVVGVPKPASGRIDIKLEKRLGPAGERVVADDAGVRAVTLYRVVEHAGKRVAWLALMPQTGRTHQLRVHCAAIGTPILGDGKYGGAEAFLPGERLSARLHLHARAIAIPHPSGGTLTATAPLPRELRETWRFFGFDAERADAGLELAGA